MKQEIFKSMGTLAAGILLLAIASLIPFSSHPQPAYAQATNGGELPYGGLHIFEVICTCSEPNVLVYEQDYLANVVYPLVYIPGVSVLYQYFDVLGALYYLGSYRPGAGVCMITVTGEDCENIPAVGLMGFLPGTGTSN